MPGRHETGRWRRLLPGLDGARSCFARCRSLSRTHEPLRPFLSRVTDPATIPSPTLLSAALLAREAFGWNFLRLLRLLPQPNGKVVKRKWKESDCEELLLQWSLILGYASESPLRLGRHVLRERPVVEKCHWLPWKQFQLWSLFAPVCQGKEETAHYVHGDHFLEGISRQGWKVTGTWSKEGIAGVMVGWPVFWEESTNDNGNGF